ncbi:hypothetical protein PHYC_01382 [Phycisphaerales bacterium]|nr:hypothetical protein PHYC_01382 [Phycisphaerales bacterium]
MIQSLLTHWPEFLIEGSLLGVFMVAACLAVFAVEHPRSLVRARLACPDCRRFVVGILMGITAVALIYSTPGQRSGAHMNPGTTLAFLTLGKVQPWDALFYIVSHFIGGLLGVLLSGAALRSTISDPSVNYVVTEPGRPGVAVAWAGEFIVSFLMMGVVLVSSNHRDTASYTGFFAGGILAASIAIEAPLSGTSLNPARTLASAIPARSFRSLWVYFTAPPVGMLAAAALYMSLFGSGGVHCAKLNHDGTGRCLFNCTIHEMTAVAPTPDGSFGIQRHGRVCRSAPPSH